MRKTGKALGVGAFVGLFWWLTSGQDFWRGFFAGLLVNELSELSPWFADRTARLVASLRYPNAPVRAASAAQEWIDAIHLYPGKLTKLLGAFVLLSGPMIGAVKQSLTLLIRVSWRLVAKRLSPKAVARVALVILRPLLPVAVLTFVVWTVRTSWSPSELGTVQVRPLLTAVIGIFTVVVGVVAVLMIIIGGLKYVTSSGDSSNISSAKNTIIYAVIGLVVAALSQAILSAALSQI